MSTYRRLYVPEGTYFFTLVTYNRKPILCTPDAIKRLKLSFQYAREIILFTVNGLVILPDHLNCILQFHDDHSDFSHCISIIKKYFSISMKSAVREKREKKIWQRRFWEHLIRNEMDYERHLDYIYYNPVKHGYVKNPYDWEYSTFRRDVKSGLYSQKWGAHEEPGRIVGLDFE